MHYARVEQLVEFHLHRLVFASSLVTRDWVKLRDRDKWLAEITSVKSGSNSVALFVSHTHTRKAKSSLQQWQRARASDNERSRHASGPHRLLITRQIGGYIYKCILILSNLFYPLPDHIETAEASDCKQTEASR